MCPARLIDAADHEIRLTAAYAAPSLRPSSLTWCRVCGLHRCGHPDHAILTFDASEQDADGVWVFRSADRWPSVLERTAVIHDHLGNPLGTVPIPLTLPEAVAWGHTLAPLWCRKDVLGHVVYRVPEPVHG